MKYLRQHILFRYLWLVVALNIINFSIDSPDSQHYCIPENLDINDMESVMELVLEKMMGIENAVAEQDEQDADEQSHLKKNLDNFVLSFHINQAQNFPLFLNLLSCKYQKDNCLSFYPDICPPPPKA